MSKLASLQRSTQLIKHAGTRAESDAGGESLSTGNTTGRVGIKFEHRARSAQLAWAEDMQDVGPDARKRRENEGATGAGGGGSVAANGCATSPARYPSIRQDEVNSKGHICQKPVWVGDFVSSAVIGKRRRTTSGSRFQFVVFHKTSA